MKCMTSCSVLPMLSQKLIVVVGLDIRNIYSWRRCEVAVHVGTAVADSLMNRGRRMILIGEIDQNNANTKANTLRLDRDHPQRMTSTNSYATAHVRLPVVHLTTSRINMKTIRYNPSAFNLTPTRLCSLPKKFRRPLSVNYTRFNDSHIQYTSFSNTIPI